MLRRNLLSVLLIAAVASTASAADTVSGDGMVYCWIVIPGESLPCGPELRGTDIMRLETGDLSSATLTVSWDANSVDSEEMGLWLHGNGSCTEPGCWLQSVEGRSPLTVTLLGVAASGQELRGFFEPLKICKDRLDPHFPLNAIPGECNEPFVRVIKDLPFRYEWTLVE